MTFSLKVESSPWQERWWPGAEIRDEHTSPAVDDHVQTSVIFRPLRSLNLHDHPRDRTTAVRTSFPLQIARYSDSDAGPPATSIATGVTAIYRRRFDD